MESRVSLSRLCNSQSSTPVCCVRKSFLHKFLHSLAAVNESGFQQIATFGQGTYIDGFNAVFKVHHLFPVHAEDFHLLKTVDVKA